jgi:N-acetylglutamate synthase-like GNAT family acetyltransferase
MDQRNPSDLPPLSASKNRTAGIQTPPRYHLGGDLFRPAITIAKARDLKFIVHLQQKFSNQLGFLPVQALIEYVDNGWVGVAHENGEPCGYVLGRPAYKYQPLLRPITQTAVAMDAQRRKHGLALLDRLHLRAIAAGQQAMQATCRADLEANDFWSAAGFEPICELTPDNARQQPLIVWRKLLARCKPDWFHTPPPRTGARNHKP